MLLEDAIGSLGSGSWKDVEKLEEDLRARVQRAESLARLDLAGESRVRESLRERLAQELEGRSTCHVARARRRPWVLRRPVLATGLGVALALALLAVVTPRTLAALVDRVVMMIEKVRVGDHTEIVRSGPQTGAEQAAILERHRQRLRNGQSWFLHTPYGGFGGSVPAGGDPRVQRVSSLDRLRSLTPMTIQAPTCLHRDAPVVFDHAFVAPDGCVLVFFGSGPNELLLSQFPVGEGRSVAFSRARSRTTPRGEVVTESPELKTEEMALGGHTVVWDPGPEPPSPRRTGSSALRWEEDGVSYSLMGRSLTRGEAIDLFLSLRPLDDVP
jgi:hypothetical protein